MRAAVGSTPIHSRLFNNRYQPYRWMMDYKWAQPTEVEDPIDDQVEALVRRVFSVTDRTLGDPRRSYLVRYGGQLLNPDSEGAYDFLYSSLRPHGLTPLFRVEEGRQAVYLVPSPPEPRPSNRLVNLVLLVLTMMSVLFAGALFAAGNDLPGTWAEGVRFILTGWPFALSIMAILGAHEMGHYLTGRYHGIQLTLPYFIPFPLSPFGTMGAFISMKAPPKNRNHLLDVGIAGPLAGFIIAVPVLLIGLSLSTVSTLPAAPSGGPVLLLEGNSIFYLGAKYLVFGRLLPAPESYQGIPALIYWIRYLLAGSPMPYGGLDVSLHPVAWAGWAGLLVTGLNLLPAGQLDGGHVLYVLFGRERARLLLPLLLVAMVGLGFIWSGWWLWALLLFVLGRQYAEPLDQITPLSPGRRVVAILGLVLFFLVFIPVPIVLM